MTAQELIAELQKYPADMKVMVFNEDDYEFEEATKILVGPQPSIVGQDWRGDLKEGCVGIL